jgi:hypothetical protein
MPGASPLRGERIGRGAALSSTRPDNARPYQTQIDFLATGTNAVVAVETKFSEPGLRTVQMRTA